ncbi:putative HMG-Y-related protein A-like [Cocos nucifera]|uniref:Putative HMG-Y-related protein A-like n=1 Tax=Cocos nucifera TaxID=13894 RepID=A0A8K0ILE6_COCNU|nr:putative HMG-Y-related protein A-like [Cocos nucifera]
MAAISRYVRSNYDDIPEGHDRLLPYYLSKLTAQGEFVMTAPGRFAVADDAGAEPALASSRPGHAKPTSSSSKAIDDDKDDDPGTTESPPPPSSGEGPGSSKSMGIHGNGSAWLQPMPTAHEGDIVERIESSAPVSGPESEGHAQPPSDRKTSPSQGDSAEESDYVLALPWEGPPAAVNANKGDGSKSLHKRHGCPRKSKAVLVDNCRAVSVDLDQGKDCNDGKHQDNGGD